MRPHRLRHSAPVLATALLGGALLLPASTVAAAMEAPTEGCTVADASITWGFKESFRSYISGSIAKGTWEVLDGATYETPSFGFSGGTGTADAEAGTGSIAFGGAIRFTGHGGLLDTTVANPTIELTGPDAGRLLLDLRSVPMEAAMAGQTDAETLIQVPFADLDLSGATIVQDGGTLTIGGDAVPAAITAEGFEAFGSYEAGTALDPLTFSATGTCAVPTAAEATEPLPAASEGPALAAGDDDVPSPGLIIAIVGGLIALAGGVTAAIVAGRRKSGAA
ncbi:HtaA domain-containing protein [Arenivirga flava]|uniref:Htaa domain-containing protein n=1 Tax=Arenivirga flava TaxID=1930060 RepID=A0AA37UMC9_9MICO|nr:HtaA domain-containing protein [Arenivirga flava]GMA26759.1 hypothetical protein GCM10025874_00120 [Arenivirga flava]GMA29873.1 hypothetical protein GCM10025874_31260 [Arenivirga flava]GMA29998.1 hypothetical protein GCM10025874_32510 [Arenivirga flava]